MVIGLHTLLYSKAADKDRAFFKDILGWNSVDAGEGWLIMQAPPTEMGVHPTDDDEYAEMYLMCDDIDTTIADLKKKGITCSAIRQAGWGKLTQITLPSGGTLGMYQPRHALAIEQK
jgi:hypothetical protein